MANSHKLPLLVMLGCVVIVGLVLPQGTYGLYGDNYEDLLDGDDELGWDDEFLEQLQNDEEVMRLMHEEDEALLTGRTTARDIQQQLLELMERRTQELIAKGSADASKAAALLRAIKRELELTEEEEASFVKASPADAGPMAAAVKVTYSRSQPTPSAEEEEESTRDAVDVAPKAEEAVTDSVATSVAPTATVTAAPAAAAAVREDHTEAVVAINNESFDEALLRHPYTLVEFYAPWCGHCKKLAPELEAAARLLRDKPEVLFAKVDCTVEEVLCRRFDVRGYPTLKFFRHGKYVMEYELGRTSEELVAFMKRKSTPTTQVLGSEQKVKDFMAAHPTCLVVYATANSDALLGVRDAANQAILEDFMFGEVSDLQLIQQLGEKEGTAKIYRSFAEEPYVITNPTPSSVLAAVLAHGYPHVENGPDGWKRAMSRKVPIIILFTDEREPDIVQETMSWFTEVAKANINSFSFLYSGKDFHSRLPSLGASGDVIPTVVAVDAETTKSWPFDESLTLNRKNLEAMLKGITDGSLRPHYKSQAPPAENTGDVLTVVGDTFEELVLNNDKDVLIEFYAPWCGHCKQLAPTWEEVGAHFSSNDNVIVAKMDASANDNSAVVVAGYPTIYLFPAGDKGNPIEYKGLTRHRDDFVSFVLNHATYYKRKPVVESESPVVAAVAAAGGVQHADDHDHDEL